MAYVTGSAASFADLKTAIYNAAVAAGYTLSNDIISKNGCFFKLTASASALALNGGTAQSGSTLTNPSGTVNMASPASNGTIVFPVNYEIHSFTSPDELYCFINYNSDYYQHMAFGKSAMPGVGLGAWITASWTSSIGAGGFNLTVSKQAISPYPFNGAMNVGLFCGGNWSGPNAASYYRTTLDGEAWYSLEQNGTYYNAGTVVASLLTSLPNLSNQATVLLPIKAVKNRSSGGLTTVVDLQNARLCRIDNLTPGDLVTYGPDQWKIYPWYRKDINNRNGQSTSTSTPRPTHSGTFGFAIKYTGT